MRKENFDAVEKVGKLLGTMMTNLTSITDKTWRNASATAVISVIVSEIPEVLPDIKDMFFGGDSDE